MLTTLEIRGGKLAVVDADLWPFLSRWQWSLNNSGYPTSGLGMLHHLCFGPRPGRRGGDVCHKDDDKLNCRRDNLFLLPHWLNQVLNVPRSGSVKGISQLPSGKWKVEIGIAGVKVYLGTQPSRAAAVRTKITTVAQVRDAHLAGHSPEAIRSALTLAR